MDIERAGKFIYRNARPLDLARWQYHFENGSREAVLKALAAYQNEDGGFGHGLEADCWNPNSSPIQTWAATETLREVNLPDPEHPIIRGILRYLASTGAFDGHMWFNTVPSNDDFPHAPWWNADPSQALTYNPTASLAGFLLQYANPGSELYATAMRLAKEAFAYFQTNYPLDSMHTVSCFAELYESLRDVDLCGEIDRTVFRDMLQKQIQYLLTEDTAAWAADYVCKPSLFLHSRDSVFYPGNEAVCSLECDFISETQEADGSWKITWEWSDYPEQWHISKNWWKSDLIIKNVRFYNAMTR